MQHESMWVHSYSHLCKLAESPRCVQIWVILSVADLADTVLHTTIAERDEIREDNGEEDWYQIWSPHPQFFVSND